MPISLAFNRDIEINIIGPDINCSYFFKAGDVYIARKIQKISRNKYKVWTSGIYYFILKKEDFTLLV